MCHHAWKQTVADLTCIVAGWVVSQHTWWQPKNSYHVMPAPEVLWSQPDYNLHLMRCSEASAQALKKVLTEPKAQGVHGCCACRRWALSGLGVCIPMGAWMALCSLCQGADAMYPFPGDMQSPVRGACATGQWVGVFGSAFPWHLEQSTGTRGCHQLLHPFI